MTTLEEKLKFCAVKVNEGSGCVFQPNSVKFSYVLTVKHNLMKAGRLMSSNEIKIFRDNPNTGHFQVISVYVHDELDIAIVKIVFQNKNFDLYSGTECRNEELCIYGYPDFLEENGTYRTTLISCSRDINILGTSSFEMTTEYPMSTFNKGAAQNLIGFSGSGIFKIDGENIILKGIFPRLNDPEGAHNKVNGLHIEPYNELLKLHGQPQLHPSYLTSFEFLRNDAFNLNLDRWQRENLNRTISYLKLKAKEVIAANITPVFIKEYFKERLLVNDLESDSLSNRKIWGAWLEFLTVLNITKDKQHGLEHIEDIFNNHRLKYLDTEDDWTEHLKELQYSEYIGLRKEAGKVFIKTKGNSSDTGKLYLPKNKIKDITRVYEFEMIKTDSGNHPFSDFEFYHLDYLKKECILKKEDNFRDLENQEDILKALQNEYIKLFG